MNHITPETPASGPISGRLMGGQQPIVGASVQLYAVGTTGDGSAATPLLKTAVTTDQNGNFNISNDYNCPSSTSLVYLVGTGGNPGVASANSDISLMAALGACGTLATAFPYLTVNEVTTVASVSQLFPFMTSYSAIGSGASDASTLAASFTAVGYYVNVANGTAPGSTLPTGYYASSNEIDALANIVSACVNSTGGSSSDGTLCGSLFYYSKPASGAAATNVIGAIIDILNNPIQNLPGLFSLTPPSPPFQPTTTATPSSWTFPLLVVPAAPAFSLTAGTYANSQTLTISDTTTGAAVYYTIGGNSTPSPSSALYSGPITISNSETVNAIAVNDGRAYSNVTSAAYVITNASTTAVPTFSPAGGVYNSTQTVTLASGTPNAVIYYTTNGSVPTTSSSVYTTPITVSSTESIQAFAVAPGEAASSVVSSAYSIGNGSTTGYIYTVVGAISFLSNAGNLAETLKTDPAAITADSSGGYYIADQTAGVVYKVSSTGIVSTVAPSSNGYTPSSVAVDLNNNVYFVDSTNAVVWKVAPGGTPTIFAGTGVGPTACGLPRGVTAGNGDGGPATDANVCPQFVAVDTSGNLYIVDGLYTIRKVNTSGVISTFAAYPPSSGTSDAFVQSTDIQYPTAITVDASGNVYVAVDFNVGPQVIKITPTGSLSVVAGSGLGSCSTINGSPATNASFELINALALDSTGSLYISDNSCGVVRKVNASSAIATIAGGGNSISDGVVATTESFTPTGMTVDSSGNPLIAVFGEVKKVVYGAAPPTAAAPVFSPTPNVTYTSNQTVTMSSATSGATIVYYEDCSQPAISVTGVYSGPLQVTGTAGTLAECVLEAYTVATGYVTSSLTLGTYGILIP